MKQEFLLELKTLQNLKRNNLIQKINLDLNQKLKIKKKIINLLVF